MFTWVIVWGRHLYTISKSKEPRGSKVWELPNIYFKSIMLLEVDGNQPVLRHPGTISTCIIRLFFIYSICIKMAKFLLKNRMKLRYFTMANLEERKITNNVIIIFFLEVLVYLFHLSRLHYSPRFTTQRSRSQRESYRLQQTVEWTIRESFKSVRFKKHHHRSRKLVISLPNFSAYLATLLLDSEASEFTASCVCYF